MSGECDKKVGFSKAQLIVIAVILNVGFASTYFYWQDAKHFRQGEPTLASWRRTATLKVGEVAPDFQLPAYPAGVIKLSDLRAKKRVLLAFYPDDADWRGVAEMRSLSYALGRKRPTEIEVLGIAHDSLENHRLLSNRFALRQNLLSDHAQVVARRYGIVDDNRRTMMVAIFVNKDGVIDNILEGRAGNVDSMQLIANRD
jgi:peroxiredoxin